MFRILVSVILVSVTVIVAGCNGATADPPATATDDVIDYSTWPAVTPEAVKVFPGIFADCEMRPEAMKEWRRRGDHFVPAVKVYANPLALEALRADSTSPMPVGSVVVKEKWWNENASQPMAYAAMIKREPGYDTEHADWEYLYARLVDSSAEPMRIPDVTRGKLQGCIGCHQAAADKDYLYRQYKDWP